LYRFLDISLDHSEKRQTVSGPLACAWRRHAFEPRPRPFAMPKASLAS